MNLFKSGDLSANIDVHGNMYLMQAAEEYTLDIEDFCQMCNWLICEGHLAVDNGTSASSPTSIPRIRVGR